MNPYFSIKRYSGPLVLLVLVILSLTMGVVSPASGLKNGELEGANTTKPVEAGPQALALNNPSVIVSAASVTPEVLYYHQDATGNLAAMTDDSGQVVWQADLRPFGQGSASSTDHPLRFAGQPQESDIGGLYHLGARVYDPVTGRFMSPDPLRLAAVKREAPQRFNQYSYALNNPYRYHDASGLQATETPAASLKRFLKFYEKRLGTDANFLERRAAFGSSTGVVHIVGQKPGQALIQNKDGQGIFLWEGAMVAGAYFNESFKDQPMWGSWTIKDIADNAKANAREDILNYFMVGLLNPLRDDGTYGEYSGERRSIIREKNFWDLGAQIRGVELIIDYIVRGGDLRDYFDQDYFKPAKNTK